MGKEEYGPPPVGDAKSTKPPAVLSPPQGPPPFAPPAIPGSSAPHAAGLAASSHPSLPFAAGGSASKSKNWMGLTALVAGALGVTPLAIAAGVGGLRAAKHGRATNKLLAIAGIVAGVVTPFAYLYAASNIGDSWREAHGHHVAFEDLKPGDCVREPGGFEDVDGELDHNYMTAIGCTKSHWGQIYYFDDIEGYKFPTDAEMEAATIEICESDAAIANVKQSLPTSIGWGSVVPTRELWPESHTVFCILLPSSGNLNQNWVVTP